MTEQAARIEQHTIYPIPAGERHGRARDLFTAIGRAALACGPRRVCWREPTGRHARTASPLSVFDYMKRISVGYVTKTGYAHVANDAHRLAVYEGFDAHARAVSPLRRQLLGE